jgi:hypothetical protein
MKLVVSLLLLCCVFAFSETPQESTAKVVDIKKYSRGRITYWDKYVPIYDGYPVYDITLNVDNKSYIVRYESVTGYYPAAWAVGNSLQVKKQRGRFLLKKGEEEVPARIVSKDDCLPFPSRYESLPQLPCP